MLFQLFEQVNQWKDPCVVSVKIVNISTFFSYQFKVPIGKLLIQTDTRTQEPLLHYCKLPEDIRSRHVLLLDAYSITFTGFTFIVQLEQGRLV